MLRMGCSPKLLNSDATVDEIEIRYNRITAWCSKEEKLKIDKLLHECVKTYQ